MVAEDELRCLTRVLGLQKYSPDISLSSYTVAREVTSLFMAWIGWGFPAGVS